ncbi:hypothetical protein BGX34_000966 [Mortierella sp. NVP85]|nr:hypothetical protein BGX34_000966 [Mortierella sp. NVP85]
MATGYPAMDPLQVPELLSTIATYLDRSSLLAALQVSRAWNATCRPVLWATCRFSADTYNEHLSLFEANAPHIRRMETKGRLIGGEMRFVAQKCSNLVALSLSSCQLTPVSLDTLCAGIPALHALSFLLCSGITSKSLAARLHRLPRLAKLDIVVHAQDRGNGDWRERDMAAILTQSPLLESLRIVGPDLSHLHLLDIQRREDPLRLKHLQLVSTFISETALKALLSKSPNLVTLMLLQNANKSSTVQVIAQNCPKLEMLELRNSKSVATSAFDTVFKRCTQLTRLDIAYTLIYDSALIALSQHCSQMKMLDLTGCSRVTHVAFLQMMRSLTQLRELRVRGCTKLTIKAFSGTTEDGAPEWWGSRDTLEDLNMATVGIRVESDSLGQLMGHLGSLKRLRHLRLDEAMSEHVMVKQFLEKNSATLALWVEPPVRDITTME